MRNKSKRSAVILFLGAALLVAMTFHPGAAFAEEEAGEIGEGITVTFYNGESIYHTQTFTEKTPDGFYTGVLYNKYPSKEGEVFLCWRTGGEVYNYYYPGMNAQFTADTDLYAYFGDAAMGTEFIQAVKNGKSTYETVYDGTLQYVEFDAKNSSGYDKWWSVALDGYIHRFYLFEWWDALLYEVNWYIDITELHAEGRDAGEYLTYPTSGAEWCYVEWIDEYYKVSGKYGNIQQGTLIIKPRPVKVSTPDISVRFGDEIPTDMITVTGVDTDGDGNEDKDSGMAADEEFAFVPMTAQTVGAGQENTFLIDGQESTADVKNYDITSSFGRLDVYYEVSFELDGISGDFPPIRAYSGVALLPADEPVHKGFSFKGWAVSGSQDGTLYSPGELIHLDGNVTLYPVWQSAMPGPETGYDGRTRVYLMAAVFSAVALLLTAIIRRKMR